MLHYQSNNAISHKRSCVGVVVRIFFKWAHKHTYSNPHHQKKETDHLYIFQQDGYSHNFIKRYPTTQPTTAQPSTINASYEQNSIAIYCIRYISETTNRLLQPHSITTAHKATKALNLIKEKTQYPITVCVVVIYNIR